MELSIQITILLLIALGYRVILCIPLQAGCSKKILETPFFSALYCTFAARPKAELSLSDFLKPFSYLLSFLQTFLKTFYHFPKNFFLPPLISSNLPQTSSELPRACKLGTPSRLQTGRAPRQRLSAEGRPPAARARYGHCAPLPLFLLLWTSLLPVTRRLWHPKIEKNKLGLYICPPSSHSLSNGLPTQRYS